MSAEEIVLASRSGLIHDVGKLKTPADILNAPRALSADEWEIMRAHALIGEGIVLEIPTLRHLSIAVRSHHERLDGKGYPDGTRGLRIPAIARLVSVADSFNAMIGRRAYRKPMPPSIALVELDRHRGTQFDPDIVDAMIDIVAGSIQARYA
jgi:energy-coupling factor transport system substrate-specific component